MAAAAQDPADVLTVSALTGQIRGLLEGEFGHVWVSGEISNLVRASSGHVYLSLKDEKACLRAVLYRGIGLRLRFGRFAPWLERQRDPEAIATARGRFDADGAAHRLHQPLADGQAQPAAFARRRDAHEWRCQWQSPRIRRRSKCRMRAGPPIHG